MLMPLPLEIDLRRRLNLEEAALWQLRIQLFFLQHTQNLSQMLLMLSFRHAEDQTETNNHKRWMPKYLLRFSLKTRHPGALVSPYGVYKLLTQPLVGAERSFNHILKCNSEFTVTANLMRGPQPPFLICSINHGFWELDPWAWQGPIQRSLVCTHSRYHLSFAQIG